jgi:adiponectin receptor
LSEVPEPEPHIGDRSEIEDDQPEHVVQEEDLKTFIGHLLMAPAHLRDNEFILRGYRIGFNTKAKIIKSLFMLHNESVNVWSHLIGVFVFIALFIYTTTAVYASNSYKQLLNGDQFYVDRSI